jgi:biotin carboxyl carrier protein
MQYDVEVGGRTLPVVVGRTASGFTVTVDGRTLPVDAVMVGGATLSLLINIDGRVISREIAVAPSAVNPGEMAVRVDALPVAVTVDGRRRWGRRDDGSAAGGPQRIAAPMPGKVVRVLVKPGEAVHARQPLVVVEAMKMENELRASRDGIVAEIHAREGMSVDAGALLVVIQ